MFFMHFFLVTIYIDLYLFLLLWTKIPFLLDILVIF